jgi:histidinol-phosphate aminotransferase
VLLAASASEFIFRISAWSQRIGGSRVWIPAAAYGDYAVAAQAWGLQRTESLDDAELVWACEPSSPLGQAHAEWPQWLQQPQPAQQLVLDSAYAPLRLSGPPSLQAPVRDRVWQMVSPNKALALTGIRAAYAIAPLQARKAAQQLEAMAPSWPVGAHGEAMLLAWTQFAVQDWVAGTLPTLRDWKQAQLTLLQGLGWQCLASDANFFCARPPADLDIAELLPYLRQLGIKLRDATSLGLPGWLRLSAQPPAAQQALETALLEWSRRDAVQAANATPGSEAPAQAAPYNSSLEKSQ